MSALPKNSARWLLLAVVAILCSAGVMLLLMKEHRVKLSGVADSAWPAKQEYASSFPTAMTGAPPTSAISNAPVPEAGEDRIVAMVTKGNELLEAGNFAGAAEQYQEAVNIEPGAEDLHYNLAIALAKMGKTDDAKKHYAEALKIFPDYADAHSNLGNLLMSENKFAEAIDHFREAIRIAPQNAWFHNNLGTALGREGKPAEAIVEFKEAVRLSPSYLEGRVNLGNACVAAGQLDEAITNLEEALRLRPGFQPALQGLNRARQKQASGSVPR